jgi:hypothetical protein
MIDPAPLDPTTPHDAARAYAALGWRVLPIRPGGKRPPMNAWQDAATTDPAIIDAWWTGIYRDHGVGVAAGPDSGIWVLDVDVADDKAGDETLADLEDSYGKLPDTVEAITGSGGRHLLFAWPPEVDVRNSASGTLGPGLDVRGAGGQVVAAPTVHANGRAYTWVDGHEPWAMGLAEAPGWLLAMLTPDEAPASVTTVAPTQQMAQPDDGPAARFNAATTWDELLTADGWTLHHTDGDGEQHWTRPGKERRDGTSATVNYRGNDALKVFTSSIPTLEAERAYSRFGYLAATRHNGDRSACAHALIANGYGRAEVPVDLSWIPAPDLEGTGEPAAPRPLEVRWVDDLDRHAMPPEPPVLVDGLLRNGEMCVFGAPRAIGKTWLAYNLAINLARGEGKFLGHLDVRRPANVLYLQGELDQWGSATRWKLLTGLGHPLPRVAETFDRVRFRTVKRRIVRQREGVAVTDEMIDADIDERLEEAIVAHGIDVVIVDPWAVYLAGAENSNDEVEAVLGTLREITLRTGVAWVIIHHITGKAERSSWTEPEDLWRGATRLADWASTRVTVLPHYTEAQYKELGITRREARRHANVHFLRRSTPTDDFTMRLDAGWWVAWEPETEETVSPTLALARALSDAGGVWTSMRQAATALGVAKATAAQRVADAERAGLVTVSEGANRAFTISLVEGVEHPWSARMAESSDEESGWSVGGQQVVTDHPTTLSDHPLTTEESVSDQGKHDADHTSGGQPVVNDDDHTKPQVKCGEPGWSDHPPYYVGGGPGDPHPVAGEVPGDAIDADESDVDDQADADVGEDTSWLF